MPPPGSEAGNIGPPLQTNRNHNEPEK